MHKALVPNIEATCKEPVFDSRLVIAMGAADPGLGWDSRILVLEAAGS